MPECYKCGKSRRRVKDYYGLSICNKCYSELGLQKMIENKISNDPFLEGIILPEDHQYIKALNTFASSFSKKASQELLGICRVNIEDEEMDDILLNSFIIASRSVLLFGSDDRKKKIEDYDVHFLLNLANVVGVSIIGAIVRRYDQLGLDVGDELIEYDIEDETNMVMTSILNDIRYNDTTGDLRKSILRLYKILAEY